MTNPIRIIPPALQTTYDNWHFAPAVISNGHNFVSGIIGTSPDGERPSGALAGAESSAATSETIALQAVRDPEAQFDTAFEALSAILHHAGATLSAIGVAELLVPGGLMEIRAIARVQGRAGAAPAAHH